MSVATIQVNDLQKNTSVRLQTQVSNLPIKLPTKQLNSLCQRYQIKELALFGSVLREDFNANSDVDMLVTFQTNAKIGFIAFNRLQHELSTLLNCPVDLVSKKGLKAVIKPTILKEAKIIYAV